MLLLAIFSGELGVDGLDHRLQPDDTRGGGKAGQQGHVGHRTADVLATEIGGGTVHNLSFGQSRTKSPRPNSSKLRLVLIRM
jgi:hypothetical protein